MNKPYDLVSHEAENEAQIELADQMTVTIGAAALSAEGVDTEPANQKSADPYRTDNEYVSGRPRRTRAQVEVDMAIIHRYGSQRAAVAAMGIARAREKRRGAV